MRVRSICAVAIAAGLAGVAAHAASPSTPALVPQPRELRRTGGAVELGPGWVIVATTTEDRVAAGTLVEEIADRHGWAWKVVNAPRGGPCVELRSVAPTEDVDACALQGYRMIVDRSSIVIEAATAQGRFYGVQTLRQLVRGSTGQRLPRMTIADRPALAWRGVSDDISRGQISTASDFDRILHDLAYYKINLYQPYIEDMYAFESAPGSHPDALTRDDLARLVAEGRRYHVTVCPVFQALTHQERMLARLGGRVPPAPGSALSWWQQVVRSVSDRFAAWTTRQKPDVVGTSFTAGDPATFAFVDRMVGELAEVTRGPWFHLGGDEWIAQGRTVTPDEAGAYGRHFRDLSARLATRGTRSMIYGDVLLAHPEVAADLPRGLAIVDWQYHPADAYPSIDRIRALDFRDVIVSPGLWNWRTFHPDYARGFANIASFTDAGKRSGALGSVVASWGDDGAESLRDNNWSGYAYAAACAWEDEAPARDPFLRRFVTTFHGVDAPGLARAETLVGWQDLGGNAYAGRLLHRHPAVNVRPPASRTRSEQMRAAMIEAQRELAAAGAVRQHDGRIASLRHSARRFRFVAERELVLDRAGRALTAAGAWSRVGVAERNAITAELDRLCSEAAGLEREYRQLWLQHNRPAGLEFLLARQERDRMRLTGVLARARTGSLAIDRSFAELETRDSAR